MKSDQSWDADTLNLHRDLCPSECFVQVRLFSGADLPTSGAQSCKPSGVAIVELRRLEDIHSISLVFDILKYAVNNS